jgi:hypothetical protein
MGTRQFVMDATAGAVLFTLAERVSSNATMDVWFFVRAFKMVSRRRGPRDLGEDVPDLTNPMRIRGPAGFPIEICQEPDRLNGTKQTEFRSHVEHIGFDKIKI